MSCDKWAYDPVRCEGHLCCGDCDYCMMDEMELEDIDEEEDND